MARDMSNKEFYELMEKVGLNSNTTIANMVCLGYRLMAQGASNDTVRELHHKNADTIYYVLDELGEFDWISNK